MDTQESAKACIAQMNGKLVNGSYLTVKEFTSRSKQSDASALTGAYGQTAAAAAYGYAQPAYGYATTAYGQTGYQTTAYGTAAAGYPAATAYGTQAGYTAAAGYPAATAYAAQTGAQGYEFQQGAFPAAPAYASQRQGTDASSYGAIRQTGLGQHRFNPMAGRPQTTAAAQGPVDPNNNTLFVFHLPTDVNEESLRQLFSVYGAVTDTSVVRNKEDNTSRGFGFVTFSTHQEAQNAMELMNGYQIGGKYLKVSFKK
jgi:hypothetical protein